MQLLSFSMPNAGSLDVEVHRGRRGRGCSQPRWHLHLDPRAVPVGFHLIKVAQNLATRPFLPRFSVIHNTIRRRKHNVSKLTSREQVVHPSLDIGQFDVEAGRDHTTLVQTPVELHNDLSSAAIIDELKLANVAVLHHHSEELDHDLGCRANEHLTLPSLLSIHNAVEAVVQHTHKHHF
jgi:hypothetical protein